MSKVEDELKKSDIRRNQILDRIDTEEETKKTI